MSKPTAHTTFFRKMITFLAQFSKRIVCTLLAFLGIAMIASYVLPILFPEISQNCISIFNTMADLVKYGLLGYFGKAGFENVKKISTNDISLSDEEVG